MKYILLVIISLFTYSCARVSELKLLESENYLTIIPVEIGDSVYSFIWDTGSQNSYVDKALVERLGLKSTGDSVPVRAHTDTIYSSIVKSVDFGIGDFEFTSDMLVGASGVYGKYNGLIGCDIINKFCWLFDFENQTVRMSDQHIEASSQDAALRLDLEFEPLQVAVCPVMINDSVIQRYLFDSALSRSILSAGGHSSNCFVVMSANQVDIGSLFFYGLYKYGGLLGEYATPTDSTQAGYCYEVPRIKFNNLIVENAIFFLKTGSINDFFLNENVIGYISANFIRQFRAMYYDPFDRTIEFYK